MTATECVDVAVGALPVVMLRRKALLKVGWITGHASQGAVFNKLTLLITDHHASHITGNMTCMMHRKQYRPIDITTSFLAPTSAS